MPKIRRVEIKNFRGIAELSFDPSDGFNCLVGPGDSGKSTIIDAIDICLGARRNLQFTDADFNRNNHKEEIRISVTVGELPAEMKSLESYALFVRSYDTQTHTIFDEPTKGNEVCLTVTLVVAGDLEPQWALFSERSAEHGTFGLQWAHRQLISPLRLGSGSATHLGWGRGSLLSQLTEAQPETGIKDTLRSARSAFAVAPHSDDVKKALKTVESLAQDVGISLTSAQISLDTSASSFGSGMAVVADQDDVALSRLGLGSTRLLVAAMQKNTGTAGTILLVDEIEHGLEPHRVIQLLHNLGANDAAGEGPQVFAATHSPIALCELSWDQISIVRKHSGKLSMKRPSEADQGLIRTSPAALLSKGAIVCEGPSEAGFLRGVDQHRARLRQSQLPAMGISLVHVNGVSEIYRRALPYQSLEYRVAVLRDDDDGQPKEQEEATFIAKGGRLFKWRSPFSVEEEIFAALSDTGVGLALAYAEKINDKVDDHIKSYTSTLETKLTLAIVKVDPSRHRVMLGRLAKKSGWFKTHTFMQSLVAEVVLDNIDSESVLAKSINEIYNWASAK